MTDPSDSHWGNRISIPLTAVSFLPVQYVVKNPVDTCEMTDEEGTFGGVTHGNSSPVCQWELGELAIYHFILLSYKCSKYCVVFTFSWV